MPTIDPKVWYQFALQHIAAEAFLSDINLNDTNQVRSRLQLGNNNEANSYVADLIGRSQALPGFLRLTPEQADGFLDRYTVVEQLPNDASGFSATLLLDRSSGQYTLAFRSLEYGFIGSESILRIEQYVTAQETHSDPIQRN